MWTKCFDAAQNLPREALRLVIWLILSLAAIFSRRNQNQYNTRTVDHQEKNNCWDRRVRCEMCQHEKIQGAQCDTTQT
jgi:cytochrome c-type biogenesis protein CcmH/NrfF